MNKENSKPEDTEQDEMCPEYDFATMKGGVRGKYYKAYRAGHTVKIYQEDGTTIVQNFTLEDGAVMLDPDVRTYFPNSEAVNKVLRTLITLIPEKRRAVKTERSRKGFSASLGDD